MLSQMQQDLEALSQKLDEQTLKMLKLNQLLRLLKKIENLEDQELEAMIKDLYHQLQALPQHKNAYRVFRRNVTNVQDKAKKVFNIHEKGTLQAYYLGLGLVFGSAIGVALSNTQPAMLSVGIGVGLAVGAGLGAQKEKEAQKKDQLY